MILRFGCLTYNGCLIKIQQNLTMCLGTGVPKIKRACRKALACHKKVCLGMRVLKAKGYRRHKSCM
ncbi:unnamed protein product [Prunus brigantina]